jgi:hypothetical protein
MSTKTKTLAKSLHTISALAAVARYLQRNGVLLDAGDAVAEAAEILGYEHGHADPHGLKAKAIATLRPIPGARLRHHVTGAIERGEAEAITEKPGEALAAELARNPLRVFQ